MRILFLTMDKRNCVSFYRAAGIARDLEKKLDCVIDTFSWSDFIIEWSSLIKYDIVMVQRGYQNTQVLLCKYVKKLGIPLWLDYDDDLFKVPPENKSWPIYNDPDVQKDVISMLMIADVISVTTEDLKTSLSDYNSNIVVIPNGFNDFTLDKNRILKPRSKTVVWRGSDTHVYDIMVYSDIIDKCIKEHADYSFVFMGFNPWVLLNAPNLKFIKVLELLEYFETGISLAPTVVHIPLYESVFNRCKSNIAFIEGTYWGATCIVPEFWGKIPGTLSYKDSDSYYNAVNTALEYKPERNEESWDYIKKNLLSSEINKLRVKLINDLL
jgi:hypothetical protein